MIQGWQRRRSQVLRRRIRARNVIPAGSSNVVARADLLRRTGEFDPSLTHLADWDLWIRLAEAGRPAACPEPLVAYDVQFLIADVSGVRWLAWTTRPSPTKQTSEAARHPNGWPRGVRHRRGPASVDQPNEVAVLFMPARSPGRARSNRGRHRVRRRQPIVTR